MCTSFEQVFEKHVSDTIRSYRLISKDDGVLVACSGGKDSTTVAHVLKKLGHRVSALTIDLHIGDYSARNLANVRQFCTQQDIPLTVVDIREEFGGSVCFLRSAVQDKRKISNCTVCGIFKRWLLNKKARDLGFSKIATGHNMDDEAESILMNLLRGKPELGLGLGLVAGVRKDARFVPRIKPLYFCLNKDVRRYSELKGFPVVYEPCPCSSDVFRRQVRTELAKLEEEMPEVKGNIVKYWQSVLPGLKRRYKTTEPIKACELCGEPSRNAICSRCRLLVLARS